MPTPRATLDTNIPYRLRDNHVRQAVTERLLAEADAGTVELVVTRHIEQDVRHEPYASRAELPELGVAIVPGVFLLADEDGVGGSLLDGDDMLGDDALDEVEHRLNARPAIHTPGEVDFTTCTPTCSTAGTCSRGTSQLPATRGRAARRTRDRADDA